MKHNSRSIALSLLLLALGLGRSWAGPAIAAPWSAPGPFKVLVANEEWRDESRSRNIPVRIYSPEAAPGSLPVVIFSHGLAGSRTAGEAWGRQWASWGIVSVHLQHPGSDTTSVRQAPGTFTDKMKSAMTFEQLVARTKDVSFAADEIARRAKAGDAPFAQVDASRIGLSGHSFGALTTLAVAGQRMPDGLTPFADPRFRAFIALSPSPRSAKDVKNAYLSITAPFLSITGSQDQVYLTPEITPDDRVLPFEGMASGNKYLLWLNTATHMSFAGQMENTPRARLFARTIDGASLPPDQPHIDEMVKAVSTAFWLAYLSSAAELGKQASAWLTESGPGALCASGDRWRTH